MRSAALRRAAAIAHGRRCGTIRNDIVYEFHLRCGQKRRLTSDGKRHDSNARPTKNESTGFATWYESARKKTGNMIAGTIEKTKDSVRSRAERASGMASASFSRVKREAAISAEEARSRARTRVSETISSISKQSAEKSKALSKKLADAVSPTVESTQKLVRDGVSKSVERAQSGMASVVDAAKANGSALNRSTQDFVSSHSHQAVNVVGSTVNRTVEQATSGVTQNVKKAVRWFFFWSISVVAVYGVASTVPKELVKDWKQSRISSKDDAQTTPHHEEKGKGD